MSCPYAKYEGMWGSGGILSRILNGSTDIDRSNDVPRGVAGVQTPRNSEGPPKSRQTQPDCENC